MIKKYVLIFFILFSNDSFAEDIESSLINQKIVEENKNISKDLWKEIGSIQTKLMQVQNRTQVLQSILEGSLKSTRDASLEQTYESLIQAKNHLLLGNRIVAINEVDGILKSSHISDVKTLAFAYKILFEANRMEQRFTPAANICSTMLSLSNAHPALFSNKWKMLCSYSFLRALQESPNKELKNSFMVWSLNPQIQTPSNKTLLSNILVALALREIDKNGTQSIQYLLTAIARTKESDLSLGRAYITLALLYFERKDKDNAFSIFYDLSTNTGLKNSNYKALQVDDMTRWFARLCLARVYASQAHFKAAQTWYEDVLTEIKTANASFVEKQKDDILYEYAQVLYKQKNYRQSQIALKQLLQENNSSNLMVGTFKLKLAKALMGIILNKDPTSPSGDPLLLQLFQEARVDLEYLKTGSLTQSSTPAQLKKRGAVLAMLAQEYELNTNQSQTIIRKYLNFEQVQESLSHTKSDFLNAMNSIGYLEEDFFEDDIQTSFSQVDKNFSEMKSILVSLNTILNKFYSNSNKYSKISQDTILQTFRMLDAIDDDISIYSNTINSADNIYKKNLMQSIKSTYHEIFKLKSHIAGLNFSLGDNSTVNETKMIDAQVSLLKEAIFNYKKSILSNEIFPNQFYHLNKKYDLYNFTIETQFNIFKDNKLSLQHAETDKYDLVNKLWIELIEVNKENNKTLNLLISRLNNDRKSLKNDVLTISNNINLQEKENIEKQQKILANSLGYYHNIEVDLIQKIKVFKDHIKLAMSEKTYNFYLNKKEEHKKEDIIKEQRKRHLDTLTKTIEWDLFR